MTIKKPARLFGGLQSDCTHSFMSTNAVLMVWCISLSSLWRFLKIGKYAWLLRRIIRYDRQKRKAIYSLKSCGLLVQCKGFFSDMFDWVVCIAFNFVEMEIKWHLSFTRESTYQVPYFCPFLTS